MTAVDEDLELSVSQLFRDGATLLEGDHGIPISGDDENRLGEILKSNPGKSCASQHPHKTKKGRSQAFDEEVTAVSLRDLVSQDSFNEKGPARDFLVSLRVRNELAAEQEKDLLAGPGSHIPGELVEARRRTDEDQTSHCGGVPQGSHRSNRRPVGMPENDARCRPDSLHYSDDKIRLIFDTIGLRLHRAFGETEAVEIDRDHPKALRKDRDDLAKGEERRHEPVQKNQGWSIAGDPDMYLLTVDLEKIPAIEMRGRLVEFHERSEPVAALPAH